MSHKVLARFDLTRQLSPALRGRRTRGGRPAGGQAFHRGHEVRAFGVGNAALAAGLAGFGDGHPQQALGVFSNHLLIRRLVPHVAADGQDFLKDGLLGAGQCGVRRVGTRLGLLGELLC